MERDVSKEKQRYRLRREGREEVRDDRRVLLFYLIKVKTTLSLLLVNSSLFVRTEMTAVIDRCLDAPSFIFLHKHLKRFLLLFCVCLTLNIVQKDSKKEIWLRGVSAAFVCQWRPLNSDLKCGFSDEERRESWLTTDRCQNILSFSFFSSGGGQKHFLCFWWPLEGHMSGLEAMGSWLRQRLHGFLTGAPSFQ